MARPQSKIMTAAELKVEKKAVKVEINAHAASVKTAGRALKDAKKALDAANKAAEQALIVAQKTHIAALKTATKAYALVSKEQGRIVDASTKLGIKAEARVASLSMPVTPPVAPAAAITPAKTKTLVSA